MAKEYKPAPRWKRSDYGPYTFTGTDGELAAEIRLDYELESKSDSTPWQVKTRNRAGGWNYGYSASLRAAKRKAKAMMREEAT